MTPPSVHDGYLIPEARFLDRLAQTHAALSKEDEPPSWDRLAHAAWEDRRDEFAGDCELLKEDLVSLMKEWEA